MANRTFTVCIECNAGGAIPFLPAGSYYVEASTPDYIYCVWSLKVYVLGKLEVERQQG